MICYNKEWLSNLKIQEQVNLAHQLGDVSTEELKLVEAKYPVGFYTPNVFMRAGIFLLTLVILSFGMGLLSLFMYDMKLVSSPYYLLFLGIVTYIALEYMVREKHHYQSGADDALMWVAAGLFLSAYLLFMDLVFQTSTFRYEEILVCGFCFLLAGYFTLRFADALMAITTVLAFMAFVFYSWLKTSAFALQTMPFIMMVISGAIYYVSDLLERRKTYLFYGNALIAVSVLSLILFYLSGNYFIVRELGASMGSGGLAEVEPVPFGWFFWIWTFMIPLLYIGFGLKRKDVVLLRTGLILIAAAAFTLKNYHYIAATELLLAGTGTALIAVAWAAISYLKVPKNGFTANEIEDGNVLNNIQVESLIVGETLSGTQSGQNLHQMGGGDFGGGGASGNF